MKKALYILVFVFYALSNAQTYSFDYELMIESVGIKPKQGVYQNKILINSKDHNYQLILKEDGTAVLSDNNKKLYINLLIKKDKQTNQTVILFQSERPFNVEKTWYTSAKKIGDNQFLLSTFDQKKMKRSVNEMKVILEEAPANLLVISSDLGFGLENSLYKDLVSSLDPTKTYLIRKNTVDYKNGYIFEFNLKNFEKTELSFELPEK